MEQINIIFYVLTSFFGMERGAIVAENTTVTVDTVNKTVTIVLENLFSTLQSATDKNAVISNWHSIANANPQPAIWAVELDNLTEKQISSKINSTGTNAELFFSYVNEDNLRVMGIWYNQDSNEFSVNQITQDNLETSSGALTGNYWIFKGEGSFSFTVKPFKEMPAAFQKSKVSIEELIK